MKGPSDRLLGHPIKRWFISEKAMVNTHELWFTRLYFIDLWSYLCQCIRKTGISTRGFHETTEQQVRSA